MQLPGFLMVSFEGFPYRQFVDCFDALFQFRYPLSFLYSFGSSWTNQSPTAQTLAFSSLSIQGQLMQPVLVLSQTAKDSINLRNKSRVLSLDILPSGSKRLAAPPI